MKHWLKILVALSLLPLCALSNIENFEGKIKILKEGAYDTLQIEVSVKDNIVRIDEFKSEKVLLRSYLIDLSKEKIFALSLKEKLYTEIPLRQSNTQNQSVEIIKTQNSMEINGTKCFQWRVKDKSKNSEVTFWVAQKEYNFLKSLVSILSRSETPLEIFGYFPQANGYFPLMSVDRTLLRKVKESARIIEIKPAKLPGSLFIIPPDFRELLG